MQLEKLVKGHEGLRLTPYRDTRGFDTVGWGHRCKNASKITRAMAQRLFDEDLSAAEAMADAWLDGMPPLNAPRRAVIVDMAFNLGLHGLSGFCQLQAALRAQDWTASSRAMLDSLWADQTGHRALHDAEIMRRGEWV